MNRLDRKSDLQLLIDMITVNARLAANDKLSSASRAVADGILHDVLKIVRANLESLLRGGVR